MRILAMERTAMNALRYFFIHLILAACLIASTSAALGQAPKLPATHKDIAYEDAHAAQKLDVYLAAADQPTPAMIYIHVGGWRDGSKDRLPIWLTQAVREGWLSVVSVAYRFTDVAPHPAQVNDCLRAIQFVRHHAAKWNIDPQRIGVTGGSARSKHIASGSAVIPSRCMSISFIARERTGRFANSTGFG